VAYIIREGKAVKAPVSLLGQADLTRARDTLILARRGSAHCKRLWNDFVAESPGTARIVSAWVEKEHAEQLAANDRADGILLRSEALLTKGAVPAVVKLRGSGACLSCGERLRTKDKRCPQCGVRNKFHRPKAGQMKGKKARQVIGKALRQDFLAKAAGRPVKSKSAAIRAWIEQDLDSPDPAAREAARGALARLR
jgi:hypothetical protein